MNEPEKQLASMRRDAQRIFSAAVESVDAGVAISRFCKKTGNCLRVGERFYDLDSYEKIWVMGAGKATAPMAKALENILGERIDGGIINVKYEHVETLRWIQQVEAGHPIPDRNGLEGARRMLEMARQAEKNHFVFCLISGGASALLPAPATGLSLSDKQQTMEVLLQCGATIHEINTIRKHISMIKGGRLARALYPATWVSLILSDVVGDRLDVIASGPTVPDESTFDGCLAILHSYGIHDRIPQSVLDHLIQGQTGQSADSLQKDSPFFSTGRNLIVGSNAIALKSAENAARQLGYTPLCLSSSFEGETRHVAKVHTEIALQILESGHPVPMPACLLSGGETTVSVTGNGMGGRNQEFTLAAVEPIAGRSPIALLSAGTDGTDGPTDAAGAFADSLSLNRAAALGMQPGPYLDNNDAYHFFSPMGDLLITGPTKTNVMDLRILLIGFPEKSHMDR